MSASVSLSVSIHRLSPDVPMPAYQTAGAAGIRSRLERRRDDSAGEVALVPTGS